MNIFSPQRFTEIKTTYELRQALANDSCQALSGEQKDKIIQIFQGYSTKENQKLLIKKIQKDSIMANKLHKFISLNQSNEQLKQVDYLLTEAILVDLRQILDKKRQNSEGLQKWLQKYRDYFDTETLNSLDSYDFFTVASLLKEETLKEEPNSKFHRTIEQSNRFSLYERYASDPSIEKALNMFRDFRDYSALA